MADTTILAPSCPPSKRPRELFDPATEVEGLRAARSRIEVDRRLLDVWLYHDPPAELADEELWQLVPAPGGTPVAISDASIEAMPTPHVELSLVGLPDPSRYRLQLAPPAAVSFDPLRTWLPVRLRPECPDLGSCFAPAVPDPAPDPSPVHDYLARDWRSLRRALVEYLLREDPEADLSVADPTITVLELFAHAGDLLHYRLDRIATEAYLESARLRASVRRHARLVDFAFSDGASAEAPVLVVVQPDQEPVELLAGDVAIDEPGSGLAFTLETGIRAEPALGEIAIYDFGEEACCLEEGATECVLVRPKPADALGPNWLEPGDLLVLELVDPDDRDHHQRWARREETWPTPANRFREPLPSRAAQVVRLTAVEPFEDPLLGSDLALTRVVWDADDAITHSIPVGVDSSAGADEVGVARGNLVASHHGRLVDGQPGSTLVPHSLDGPRPSTGAVAEYSLVAAGTPGHRGGGFGLSLAKDGKPHRLEVRVELPSTGVIQPTFVPSLLEAQPGELSFIVDVEEEEPPILRFKSGAVGLTPPLGSRVSASYEVGGGVQGNVPANSLRAIERNQQPAGGAPAWELQTGIRVRNPAPALGGADPTSLDVVRRDAPEAFAVQLRRAVLPADYATEAAHSPLVERAMAQRTWSGSWPLITTVVDHSAQGLAETDADARLQHLLDAMRTVGTEVAVRAGTPIGLFVALEVCVNPGASSEQVRADALSRLRPGSDTRPGVFHPSQLRLGGSVYLSTVTATIANIPGVDAAEVVEARRLSDPPGTVRQVIHFEPDEVAVLDDDPARPERGRLDVRVRGGR